MITCLGDVFFPEVGVAMVRLLRRLGVQVEFPEGQTCCGMPLFNSGYHHEAALVAARTVRLFEGAEHVVVPSGSCAWMVKTEYPGLLKHDPALRAAADSLAARTRELSQFIVEVLGVTTIESPFEGKVTYHDSCHLLRGLGESASPRALLRGVRRRGAGRAARRGRVLRLRRLLLGAAARGVLRPSSTRSWPTWSPPGPAAWWRATRAASCRWAAGCPGAAPRCRRLHLAQVLAGEVDG